MSLLTIFLGIIAVGILLWVINAYIPMDRKIKAIFNIVVMIVLVIWLLRAFGLLNSFMDMKV